jgi:hypothetical protein
MASQVSRSESMPLIVVTGIKDKTIFEQTQLLVKTEKSIQERKKEIKKREKKKSGYFKISIITYDEK